jgi:hypothetical protein
MDFLEFSDLLPFGCSEALLPGHPANKTENIVNNISILVFILNLDF